MKRSFEQCPLDATKADSDGVVWEPYLPAKCYNCIKKVLSDTESFVSLETYDGDEFEEAHDGMTFKEMYPEGHDWGADVGIKILQNGNRVYIRESGPETGGEIQYVTATERVALRCEQDQ